MLVKVAEPKSGKLLIRVGNMFSGKSTWINHEITRAADLGYSVVKIIHTDDLRKSAGEVTDDSGSTHNSSFTSLTSKITKIRSATLSNLDVDEFQVIAIDEGHFFPDLYEFVYELVEHKKKHVYVVGLDGDSSKKPFASDGKTSNILDLIPLSDNIVKLTADCRMCIKELDELGYGHIKNKAPFTKRLVSTEGQKLVGGEETYAPVCRYHHGI